MIEGVNKGFQKTLEIRGTGYRASKQGRALSLTVGYSHPVVIEAPEGIEFELPNATTIVVKGCDKQLVGQTAAHIRQVREPEPYLGKGIRYQGEYVRRKEGKKTAK
jgi:large subunit ribosomal protein L6